MSLLGFCLLSLLTTLLSVGRGLPVKDSRSNSARRGSIGLPEVSGPSDGASPPAEQLVPSNKVQSLSQGGQRSSSRQKRRWSQQGDGSQSRSLHTSHPQEETATTPFVLDLAGLANVDLTAQNPNIQVTIEVVDDPQTEFEMDLLKEPRNDWSISSAEWLAHKDLFWPLFWDYVDPAEEDGQSEKGTTDAEQEEDYFSEYDGEEDTALSGVGGDWERQQPGQRTGVPAEKDNYDYEGEAEWSSWAPCSVSCGRGNQKRTRSCGYSCTATEARTCDASHCPGTEGDLDYGTEETPFGNENTTAVFSSDVDSCEKWLSCKSDFLTKYLSQVLTDLPACPCSYPLEAVYSTVTIPDEKQARPFRWRDASGPKERLDIYKPSARFCIRSMLSLDSTTLAAQHCCYDERLKLITRGKGAGAPNLISTEFSPELHYKVDMLPWILCKGDWTRYHAVRPPNNGLGCAESPVEEEYLSQLEEAKEY
ncbi:isthmin-2 [Ambystoma mexicanum]|uniref:isthmin-2 n=1 Tax=Ambystoma mexicanum TaxID=8296 RepID=UPI0037E76319